MIDGVYKDVEENSPYDGWGYQNEPTLEKRIENLEALFEELSEEIDVLLEGR